MTMVIKLITVARTEQTYYSAKYEWAVHACVESGCNCSIAIGSGCIAHADFKVTLLERVFNWNTESWELLHDQGGLSEISAIWRQKYAEKTCTSGYRIVSAVRSLEVVASWRLPMYYRYGIFRD